MLLNCGAGEDLKIPWKARKSNQLILKEINPEYAKAFDSVDHNKLWKILKEMGIPENRTCLLRNLHAGQEATVNQSWKNGLVPNWERSTSRLYIVTLLI